VQNQYGLTARREDDELVRACAGQGVAFVPFFAVASAASERSAAVEEAVQRVAKAHDASSAQIRLAWTLHQGQHLLAIPGTGDLGHLAQNVAAAALRLTEAEVTRLDTAGTAAIRN
jgi:pyridoxine 4-dehydrogenase